ncbi:MAG: hypothetical protein M1833_005658 [Piccolia ochrophora]|nr:MAG: hypothetical protein M1833_005658 [Piccolia ochrophora]
MTSTVDLTSGAAVATDTAVSSLRSSSAGLLIPPLDLLKSTAANATSYLNPSPMDLLLAIPRLAQRAGILAFYTIPEHIDEVLGRGLDRTAIAEATRGRASNSTAAAMSRRSFAQNVNAAMASSTSAAGDTAQAGDLANSLSFYNIRNFGAVFTYVTSKWALTCCTVAIILNRTQIYASSRRRIRLSGATRLAIRGVPITMFVLHVLWLLQAMHCQTSPDFSTHKYNNASASGEFDFASRGGSLYTFSSTLLFWRSDKESCLAAGMAQSPSATSEPIKSSPLKGSLSLLWPLFQSLCISQFVETLSCALQGRQVKGETGMTIFEHSLAFAESEAMIANRLGWGPFAASFGGKESEYTQPLSAAAAISRSAILSHVNVPPEVLLIGVISSLSHLTSQVLGVFDLQGRFRLLSTGAWGLCYMGAFLWSAFIYSSSESGDLGIMRFPTVCIVGFIPHLLILIGIGICASIYLLALVIQAVSPPAGVDVPQSFRLRLAAAHENLQVSIQLSTIRLNMHDDFYTTLLKVGFVALTAASEAVFLNEGQPVGVTRWTWLEEERMKEVESAARNGSHGFSIPQDLKNEADGTIADGVELEGVDEAAEVSTGGWRSGYWRERSTKSLKASKSSKGRGQADGVGAAERSGRWMMAWEFFRGIFSLMAGWWATTLLRGMASVGISWSPGWLRRIARRRKSSASVGKHNDRGAAEQKPLEFWILSDDGVLRLPDDDEVDVEVEMRKRLVSQGEKRPAAIDHDLDTNIYRWWKAGGWFGNVDASGDFEPPPADDDDDTTSVISENTTTSTSDWETDGDDPFSGRTTPTQSHPQRHLRSSSPNPDPLLGPSSLSHLLDPQTPSDREHARILSHHLSTPPSAPPLTRSRYAASVLHRRARILTSSRHLRPPHLHNTPGKLCPADEAAVLEHLILERRTSPSSSSASSQPPSWAQGGSGLGAGGPQCVVCQSSARTVLVWPCRCLSLCEDCRVALAMNNFGNCVCCRRDVVGFSRIYVP